MDETSLSVAMLHDHVFRPEKSKDLYGTNSNLESQKKFMERLDPNKSLLWKCVRTIRWRWLCQRFQGRNMKKIFSHS